MIQSHVTVWLRTEIFPLRTSFESPAAISGSMIRTCCGGSEMGSTAGVFSVTCAPKFAAVRGPVDFNAFNRFAAICLSVAMTISFHGRDGEICPSRIGGRCCAFGESRVQHSRYGDAKKAPPPWPNRENRIFHFEIFFSEPVAPVAANGATPVRPPDNSMRWMSPSRKLASPVENFIAMNPTPPPAC